MREEAAATGLDKKMDVTPDDVVALQNRKSTSSAPRQRARAEPERELYARYRDDPERQMVAPAFVQLAREGGVGARGMTRPKRPKKHDPDASLSPEAIEMLRAYEKRRFGGDTRKLLKPAKKTPPRLQAAHDRFLAAVRRYVDNGLVSEDVYRVHGQRLHAEEEARGQEEAMTDERKTPGDGFEPATT
jgi:hypothetical protein